MHLDRVESLTCEFTLTFTGRNVCSVSTVRCICSVSVLCEVPLTGVLAVHILHYIFDCDPVWPFCAYRHTYVCVCGGGIPGILALKSTKIEYFDIL